MTNDTAQQNTPAPVAAENVPVPLSMQVAQALVMLMEFERPPLAAHCKRVATRAQELGVLSGLLDEELADLHSAALLHDIGFLSTSINLLRLAPMDKTMEEKVAKHTLLGYSIVSKIKGLEKVAEAILHHHERFDGTGFPKKLRGDKIPLFARIIAIADMFDLETHPGTNVAGGIERARKQLTTERGRALDAELTNRFLFILQTDDGLRTQDARMVELPVMMLKPGMVLARDLTAIDGSILLRSGVQMTPSVLNKVMTSPNLEWLLTTAYINPASVKEE